MKLSLYVITAGMLCLFISSCYEPYPSQNLTSHPYIPEDTTLSSLIKDSNEQLKGFKEVVAENKTIPSEMMMESNKFSEVILKATKELQNGANEADTNALAAELKINLVNFKKTLGEYKIGKEKNKGYLAQQKKLIEYLKALEKAMELLKDTTVYNECYNDALPIRTILISIARNIREFDGWKDMKAQNIEKRIEEAFVEAETKLRSSMQEVLSKLKKPDPALDNTELVNLEALNEALNEFIKKES